MGMKSMWSEFKSFAMKGSLIDLAVAVVIGASFGKVITSLVDDIIMPAVSYAVDGAKAGVEVAKEGVHKAAAAVGSTSAPTTGPATTPAVVVAKVEPPAPAPEPAPKPPEKNEAVKIDFKIGRLNVGNFIGALINFFIVAAAVFLIVVKGIGSAVKKMSAPVAASEPTTKECPKCLSLIPLKATKCSHCTADLVAG